jgi:GT2 family glycosyltransferase
MKVSLILCSKNGGARLRTCLEYIAALDAPADMEVLLVDNGSTDGISHDLMQRFASDCRHSCQVLQTFVPGNAAGRNIAILRAKGELLIFIDDDCYVDRQFVREWLKVFEGHKFGFGSGRVVRYTENQSQLGCNDRDNEILLDTSGYVPRGLIQGSNMAFSQRCLNAAGLFDSRFGAGTPFAGEEWDVALRAGLIGWQGGYFPGPKVWHDHRRQEKESRQRNLYYSYGGGAVYAKHVFRSRGMLIISHFIRELVGSRHHPHALIALLKGFFAYFYTQTPKE